MNQHETNALTAHTESIKIHKFQSASTIARLTLLPTTTPADSWPNEVNAHLDLLKCLDLPPRHSSRGLIEALCLRSKATSSGIRHLALLWNAIDWNRDLRCQSRTSAAAIRTRGGPPRAAGTARSPSMPWREGNGRHLHCNTLLARLAATEPHDRPFSATSRWEALTPPLTAACLTNRALRRRATCSSSRKLAVRGRRTSSLQRECNRIAEPLGFI